MQDKPGLDRILMLAEAVAASHGLTVVDARLSQQSRGRSLEVTIHRPGGRVGLDDCEKVSRQLEEQLDALSPPLIEGPYSLDVQSPGISRLLKTDRELQVFSGQSVEVKTRRDMEGLGSHFTGKLGDLSGEQVTIVAPSPVVVRTRGAARKKMAPLPPPPQSLVLDRADIASIRLFPEDLQVLTQAV